MLGWNEPCVGLAEVGGVGYPDDEGVACDFVAGEVVIFGDFMVDEYLGSPVSSYGSGAVNGSSRYFMAC